MAGSVGHGRKRKNAVTSNTTPSLLLLEVAQSSSLVMAHHEERNTSRVPWCERREKRQVIAESYFVWCADFWIFYGCYPVSLAAFRVMKDIYDLWFRNHFIADENVYY